MTVIRTATNKEFLCNAMGSPRPNALIFKINIDLPVLFEIFQNPDETSTLRWVDKNEGYEEDVVREESGFTKFSSFTMTGDSECPYRIRMEKP